MDALGTSLDAVNALAVAPATDGAQLVFAARRSGLYRSTDAGQTWEDAYAALKLDAPLTAVSVALSPDFASDGTVFAGALGGILRSTDRGASWSVSTLPTPPPYVVDIVVSPHFTVDGLVFAGTLEDGVFRSWDRGASWASWNFGLLDLGIYCLLASPSFAADDTLFAGAESGVFRSSNGGRAWRETAFPMEYSPVLSLAIADDARAGPVLYAGTESHGVFRSTNGGESWEEGGLQETGVAVNHLLVVLGAGRATRLVAVSGYAVLERGDGVAWNAACGAQWRTVYSLGADEASEISTAVAADWRGQPAVWIGLSDGSVRNVPLSSEAS